MSVATDINKLHYVSTYCGVGIVCTYFVCLVHPLVSETALFISNRGDFHSATLFEWLGGVVVRLSDS